MTLKNRRLLVAWAAVLAWMLLIFTLSAIPDTPENRGLPRARDSQLDNILRDVAHMTEYAILSALVWRAARETGNSGAAYPWAAGWSLLYAASDEFHQAFVVGRTCSLQDWLLDAAGVTLFLSAAYLTRRKLRAAGPGRAGMAGSKGR